MQSRAASGFRTDCPGSAVISRWKALRASMAEALSVIAAGSVTRTWLVLMTVKGRGVALPDGVGLGESPARLQPVRVSPRARRPRRRSRQRSAGRTGLLLQPRELGRVQLGQRGDLQPTGGVRDVDAVGYGDDQGASRVARGRAGDGVLEHHTVPGVNTQLRTGLLVRLGVRLALGHLVARDRDREGASRQLA